MNKTIENNSSTNSRIDRIIKGDPQLQDVLNELLKTDSPKETEKLIKELSTAIAKKFNLDLSTK